MSKTDQEENRTNEAAFRRMEESIAKSYPPGEFVAISGGEIVANASRFDDVIKALVSIGKDPSRVLVVQAGAKYPKYAIIF